MDVLVLTTPFFGPLNRAPARALRSASGRFSSQLVASFDHTNRTEDYDNPRLPVPGHDPILINPLRQQNAARKARMAASGMLLVAALCWGAGNVANKTVLLHLQPITIVGLRCLIAAVVLAPFALRRGIPLRDRQFVIGMLGVSALFAAALMLQQAAYVWTSVTNASFLVSTETIITPLLGWVVLGHRQRFPVLCAAPLTLIGAMLMAGGIFSLGRMNTGDLACLASAFFYAGWMVALGQHVIRHGRPLATTFLQCGLTAVVLLPIGIFAESPTMDQVRAGLPELFMLGVVSTAIAHLLQIGAQRFVAASIAAILVSAESLFGAAAAYLILDERLAPNGAFGACLILCAIVIVAFGAQASVVERSPRRESATRNLGHAK